VVEPVNFNGPEQIVIAGHRDAVEQAIEVATAKGAKRGVLLPVSAPFHSSLMRPAAERLAERLAGVSMSAPAIPVLHNVDVVPHLTAEEIRTALAQQRRVPCAGSRRFRRSPRAASRMSSSADQQGAGGAQQADRARPQVLRAHRRRRPRLEAALAG
jgi:acyl transferase domain-containing protein